MIYGTSVCLSKNFTISTLISLGCHCICLYLCLCVCVCFVWWLLLFVAATFKYTNNNALTHLCLCSSNSYLFLSILPRKLTTSCLFLFYFVYCCCLFRPYFFSSNLSIRVIGVVVVVFVQYLVPSYDFWKKGSDKFARRYICPLDAISRTYSKLDYYCDIDFCVTCLNNQIQ